MRNLYSDNIEDKDTYSDQDILKDVRALIAMGHREGTLIDYKKDVSEKDNWPEAAAAFANTFGGLIIFGVDEHAGKPVLLTGFDPQGVETKTKLVSILLSRIQPRPDFQIRIVNLDTDNTKEVAVLRISEGLAPPYLHSKQHEHRIYIRMAAQKAEADYLQLNGLFQKRKQVMSEAVSSLEDLLGSKSPLRVHDPPGSNQISRHFYRFILAPEDNRASRRLTLEVEREFALAAEHTFGGNQNPNPDSRTRTTTCFRRSSTNPIEQRFTISSSGSIGFISHACLKADKGFFFAPAHFCRDLINFLGLGALFYERTRYYGSCLLDVNLTTLDGTNIYRNQAPFETDDFFEPPLGGIQAGQVGTQVRISQQPLTVELMEQQLEAVLNDIARELGRILSPNFKAMTNKFVTERINQLRSL
jgi:Putative DNA-binding domain